jgi:uncharacterized protein YggE
MPEKGTPTGRNTMHKLVLVSMLTLTGSLALADDEPRTVAVSGMGSAEVAPDGAVVVMSIVARQATVAAAQKDAADVTGKVLALTDSLSIKREDVDTTAASVRADYQWNRAKEKRELVGYIAERQIAVDVNDLNKLGELIEGAVGTGVNQVLPPQLKSTKERATYREALAKAAEDARANAEQLAISLGATLGDVLTINSSGGARPPVPIARAMSAQADMAEGASETYNAGDLSFQATVNVVFELMND